MNTKYAATGGDNNIGKYTINTKLLLQHLKQTDTKFYVIVPSLKKIEHVIYCLVLENDTELYLGIAVGLQTIEDETEPQVLIYFLSGKSIYCSPKPFLQFRPCVNPPQENVVMPFHPSKCKRYGGICVECNKWAILMSCDKEGIIDLAALPSKVCIQCRLVKESSITFEGVDNKQIEQALGTSQTEDASDGFNHIIKIYDHTIKFDKTKFHVARAYIGMVIGHKVLFTDCKIENVSNHELAALLHGTASINYDGTIVGSFRSDNCGLLYGKCKECKQPAMRVKCSNKAGEGHVVGDVVKFKQDIKDIGLCIKCQHEKHKLSRKRAAGRSPVKVNHNSKLTLRRVQASHPRCRRLHRR